VRDKLREFLFPGLVLSIVASLWAVGHARELEEDVNHGVPPQPGLARMVRHTEADQTCADSTCPDQSSAAIDYVH
jgi:hypothetical protein